MAPGPKAGGPIMKLDFVPFSIETYIPITMENIDEGSYTLWFFERNQFVSEFLKDIKLHPSKRKIMPNLIRVKADFGPEEGIFYVDQNGTVLNPVTGSTFQLSKREMRKIERKVSDLIGVVDVKAARKGHL